MCRMGEVWMTGERPLSLLRCMMGPAYRSSMQDQYAEMCMRRTSMSRRPRESAKKRQGVTACATSTGALTGIRKMMPIAFFARSAAILLIAASLGGCASMSSLSLFGSSAKPEDTRPPDVLFQEGDKLLEKKDYTKAAEKFEEVDRQHPYAPEARRAIVMSAFAYHKAGKHPEAVAAARRYLTLHPGTKEAALAQHIIATAYYDRMTDPQRDQTETRKAVVEMETLIRRYPDSRYAEDAKKRIKIAKDMLAASEMNVGRYYLKKHNHLAAINRFRVVVTEYQTTAHVEEALMRLTEAYMALGITNEAETAAAVLGHNFPDSRWYKDAHALLKTGGLAPREDTGSWISRTWRNAVRGVSGAQSSAVQ